MSVDFSHTEYLSKKQTEQYKKEKEGSFESNNGTKKSKRDEARELAKMFNIAEV